jgi:hypothetical protein
MVKSRMWIGMQQPKYWQRPVCYALTSAITFGKASASFGGEDMIARDREASPLRKRSNDATIRFWYLTKQSHWRSNRSYLPLVDCILVSFLRYGFEIRKRTTPFRLQATYSYHETGFSTRSHLKIAVRPFFCSSIPQTFNQFCFPCPTGCPPRPLPRFLEKCPSRRKWLLLTCTCGPSPSTVASSSISFNPGCRKKWISSVSFSFKNADGSGGRNLQIKKAGNRCRPCFFAVGLYVSLIAIVRYLLGFLPLLSTSLSPLK